VRSYGVDGCGHLVGLLALGRQVERELAASTQYLTGLIVVDPTSVLLFSTSAPRAA